MDKRAAKRILEEDVTCEPDYTCPKIDPVIEWAEVIESNTSSIKDQMEEIRTANEELRAWGEEWKDKAAEIYVELCEANDKNASLEEELNTSVKEVEELRSKIKELQQNHVMPILGTAA